MVVANDNVRHPEVRPGNVGNLLFRLVSEDERTTLGGEHSAPGHPVTARCGGRTDRSGAGDRKVVTGSGLLGRVVSLYDGFHYGLIIALAALGLSLIFGTTGLINFAHGELVTFGAFVALVVNVIGISLPGLDLKLHLVLAVPVAVLIGVAFGFLQDLAFWGWLRRRGTGVVAMMIISIGVALLLRHLYLYFLGPEPNPTPSTPSRSRNASAAGGPDEDSDHRCGRLGGVGGGGVGAADDPDGQGDSGRSRQSALAAHLRDQRGPVIRVVWAVGGGLAALSGCSWRCTRPPTT